MQIPSSLSQTTLGDVLGRLLRASFSGCLTLTDARRAEHRVYLESGHPVLVETGLTAAKLGEILVVQHSRPALRRAIERYLLGDKGWRLGQALVDAGLLTSSELATALREQARLRLEQLFTLREASLRVGLGRSELSSGRLQTREFLVGRPRAAGRRCPSERQSRPPNPVGGGSWSAAQRRALEVLGLAQVAANHNDVRRAFRMLAAGIHPDRAPASPDPARTRAEQEWRTRRMAELSAAYHALVG